MPITPIPMTDGLVMLDLKAVEFLMNVYEIPKDERRDILTRLSVLHNAKFRKISKHEDEKKG